jgi:hypothetical protein
MRELGLTSNGGFSEMIHGLIVKRGLAAGGGGEPAGCADPWPAGRLRRFAA